MITSDGISFTFIRMELKYILEIHFTLSGIWIETQHIRRKINDFYLGGSLAIKKQYN